MLSVVVEANGEGERLVGLLTALTSAAVDGLVREVIIAGGGPPELLGVLREETGAELAPSLGEAIAAARSELLLALATEFRPNPGWLEMLGRHLRGGASEAVIVGRGGGLLRPTPFAVLIARRKAAALGRPDLKRLRRLIGPRALRIR